MTTTYETIGGRPAAPRIVHRPGTKAHTAALREELRRTSAARDRFSTIVMEYLARNGWDWPVPPDYRETWKRLDAEYTAASDAWNEATTAADEAGA
jgi:hypothetical protein